MTIEEFSPVFAVLGLQLRIATTNPQQSNREVRAYFAVLKDLDFELVAMAAQELAKTAEWFPKSSEWREATKSIEKRRSFELSDTLRQLHRRGIELCAACGDTGWSRNERDCVSKCECQKMRRLEIIGRRPLPALKALLP